MVTATASALDKLSIGHQKYRDKLPCTKRNHREEQETYWCSTGYAHKTQLLHLLNKIYGAMFTSPLLAI